MAKFVAFFILFLLFSLGEAKKKKSKENDNDSQVDSKDEQKPNLMPNSELPNPMIDPADDQFPSDQSPNNGQFQGSEGLPPGQMPNSEGQFPADQMPFPTGQFPNQSINPPDGLQNPNQQFNENGDGDGQNQMNFGSDEIQNNPFKTEEIDGNTKNDGKNKKSKKRKNENLSAEIQFPGQNKEENMNPNVIGPDNQFPSGQDQIQPGQFPPSDQSPFGPIPPSDQNSNPNLPFGGIDANNDGQQPNPNPPNFGSNEIQDNKNPSSDFGNDIMEPSPENGINDNGKESKKRKKDGQKNENLSAEIQPGDANSQEEGGKSGDINGKRKGKKGRKKDEKKNEDKKEENKKPEINFGSGELQPPKIKEENDGIGKGKRKGGGRSVSVEEVGGGDMEYDYEADGMDNNGGFGGNSPMDGFDGQNTNRRRNGRNGGIGINGQQPIPNPRLPANNNNNGDFGSNYEDYEVDGWGRRGGGAQPRGEGGNGYGIGINNGRRGGNGIGIGNNGGRRGGNQFGNGIDGEYDDYDNLGNGRRTNPMNQNGRNNNNQIDDYYDGMEGNGGIVGPLPNDYGTGGGQNWNSGTRLPEFLRVVTPAERQRFMRLEEDQNRPSQIISQEKQRWANLQGQRVANLYNQFVRRQSQQSQQYRLTRAQNVRQRLTPDAQNVDAQIQAMLNNPQYSRANIVQSIDQILRNIRPQTLHELQTQIGVIGPLDGNLPPIITSNSF